MSKIKLLFITMVAVTGVTLVSGDCWAQACNSCAAGSSVIDTTFGYSADSAAYSSACDNGTCGSAGCSACGGRLGHGAHMQQLKDKYAHAEKNCARVIARNEAWPMPFNCADRQLYFSFWEPMIDQGFEEQCVLTSAHFDAETGNLNSFGNHTVAGIMQNMPSTRRKVFLHREADPDTNNARMEHVKETINTFYGQTGPAIVEFSTKLPVTLRGSKADAISRLWAENQPTPIIPISSGAQSVGSSVGN